ncbi:MAG TPA: IS66 family transposase, partial [Ktedonobacterales bacterium]|nr:IS66 family transposase [Ktedonobacterales bacterium]
STDGLARKTKSLRRRSGKKPGGQLGHRGETLRLVATPESVVEHRPTVCAGCQAPLGAEAPEVLRERRQVHELPTLRLVVREHQAIHLRCPVCQAVTAGAFPAEAPSRAQYGPHLRALVVYLLEQQLVPYGRVREVLADLFGARLSLGTLVQWVQQAAASLEPVEAAIKAALQQAPVLHNDETGVRQAGRLAWAHVASTKRLTHYAIHAQRGQDATDAIGILPGYRGVSVHDGWKPYQANASCRHALCNIHHLRELTFLEEQYQQAWAADLKRLLRQMKAATDQARAQGATRLPQAERDGFVARYEHLLVAGLAANPPPARRPHQRGRVKQSPARNLLERLLLGQEAVLAFLDDLTIPFDNNQAERDLRLLKVQQKISGCFRAPTGAAAFARLRSYLSTLRKQGVALLAALETLFAGQPLSPTFA